MVLESDNGSIYTRHETFNVKHSDQHNEACNDGTVAYDGGSWIFHIADRIQRRCSGVQDDKSLQQAQRRVPIVQRPTPRNKTESSTSSIDHGVRRAFTEGGGWLRIVTTGRNLSTALAQHPIPFVECVVTVLEIHATTKDDELSHIVVRRKYHGELLQV